MCEKILVIDDEKDIANLLEVYLQNENYIVYKYYCAKDAIPCIEKGDIDLAILDIMLPDINGFSLCQRIREKYTYPIIMLTAKIEETDKITGLTLGADDYVTKPFPMSVFQKKLAALLSRIAKQSEEDKYNDGTFAIDFKEMTASLEGKALVFTPLEYRLLKIFTKNPQNVLTRQMLLERLWDIDENFVDEHALTVAVSRVRNKIETNGQQYIKTVYGMGYMWVGGVQK